MPRKDLPNQAPARRTPQQARSVQKSELMLEAAMQLLEQADAAALTTNAVAARAGISIGTLYQYFDDKRALLDALIERELGSMSGQILEAAQATPNDVPGDRIRRIVRAVVGAYGGRSRVHRRLIEHALTHSSGSRLTPMYAQLAHAFTASGIAPPGQAALRLSHAQAFVLTHAIAGVLRTIAASDNPPPLREIEDALVHLVVPFIATVRAPQGAQKSR